MNTNKTKQKYGYTVRPFMMKLGLKGSSISVFALLYSFTKGEYGMYWGSQRYLAETLNISMRSLQRCLKTLREKGLITNCKTKDNRRAIATLVDDETPDYKKITYEQVQNRCFTVKTYGRKGLVRMTTEQINHLMTLIDEQVIADYVVKLENMIEEAKVNNTPLPHSHYHTIKRWIYEDYSVDKSEG